ncbi:MAG: hypothetical protein RL227_397, partial [Pseudomonadota bacterium]
MYRMKKTPQAGSATKGSASTSAAPPAAASGRRIQVRKSGVHGKGVFALQAIAAGERLIEYTGEVI